jgi:hypothetical protein
MFGHGSFTMGSIIKGVTGLFSTQFDYEQVTIRAILNIPSCFLYSPFSCGEKIYSSSV